jgi:hypothetical protein
MSFWAGVVQGVKDIDVLKEKEALADERQSVRDQENAYREQIRLYNEKRDGIADSRNAALDAINAEKWGFEKAQLGQGVLNAANGLGIGGSTVTGGGGGGGGGSVPSSEAIMDSVVKFDGWSATQLGDETNSQEDLDYITHVNESFTDPKDAHEYWSVVTGIRETTGQMPTVAQLRASVSVTQIPGYADNKKKAVELLATINNMDMSTPAGLAEATDLYNQLKKIDLNAATIDADTSGFLNVEDLGKLHTQQVEILDTELATNWLSAEDKAALDIAKGVSKDILMGDFRRKYGPQALEALTGSYPQQFSRYADNPAFRSFIGGTNSNSVVQEGGPGAGSGTGNGTTDTPIQGGGTGGATGNVDTAAIFADLSKDPNNTELQRMVVETVGPEVFNSMMQEIKSPYEEYGTSRQAGDFAEQVAKDQASVDPAELANMETMLTPSDVGQTVSVGSVPHTVEMVDGKPKLIASGLSTKITGNEQVARMESTLSEGDVGMNFNIEGVDYSAALVNGEVRLVPVGDTSSSPQLNSDITNGPDQPNIEQTRLSEDLIFGGPDVASSTGAGENLSTDRSALDAVVAPYVEAKGSPLTPDEELSIGVEAIVGGLTTGAIDQAELELLIKELEQKFTQEKVQQALILAMNPQQ